MLGHQTVLPPIMPNPQLNFGSGHDRTQIVFNNIYSCRQVDIDTVLPCEHTDVVPICVMLSPIVKIPALVLDMTDTKFWVFFLIMPTLWDKMICTQ